MKTVKLIVLISCFFLVPVYSYSSELGSIRVSLIIGDVQIKTEETGEWALASINMPLKEQDRIWVPEGGRMELRLIDGSALRLDQSSSLDVLTIDQGSLQFYLAEGHAYASFRGLKDSYLQIDIPASSVRAHERSTFRVDVSTAGYTDITVYSGSVYVETRDGGNRVDAGNTLSLKGTDYAELSPMTPSDEWERWNYERDRKYIVQARPSRYLPEELESYSSDFEENGKWVSVSEYGPVWTPTIVESDWAPYRAGRWVWIGGDYVWISYEPWGWAPYHYGRWAFLASIGWCWVPPVRGAVYWGPGFVGWVYTPTYVSWVPLAPGEIYYGHGYYGPHSVNITTVNITNIHVDRIVYKNIHVHNAVTVVHRDTFVRGRHVDVHVRENPFLRERISIGRPNIRPERATMIPIVREIPHRRLPPRQISEIRVHEVKSQRPVVREKGVSVFRPGFAPGEISVRTREGKPVERRIEKPFEQRPAEREGEKPGGLRPPEPRSIVRPEERKPIEQKAEKPMERRPVEGGIVRPEDRRQPERRVDKPVEKPAITREGERVRPEQRPGEKPPEVSRERSITKQSESKIERPREIKPSERPIGKPIEQRPPERQFEKPKEERLPQVAPERPVPQRSPEKHIQKPTPSPGQPVPPARAPEKPAEQKPAPRAVEKPVEQKPMHQQPVQQHIQKPSQPQSQPAPVQRPPERPTVQTPVQRPAEKPVQQKPAQKADRPAVK